jgi:signal transduction histidine kinase
MSITPPARIIDPRVLFWSYAAIIGLLGLELLAWGPPFVGSGLAAQLRSNPAAVKLFGAGLIAAACFAAAIASTDDPVSRWRARIWFAGAHVVVFGVLITQGRAIFSLGDLGGLDWIVEFVFGVILVTVVLLSEDPVRSEPLVTLFGNVLPASTARLRSRYEQQIRAAASQEERNRLARDLHDSIKQHVFAIQTAAATAQARFDEDAAGARQAMDHVRACAREAMTEMDAMLDHLRAAPLENVGLVEALKKQCEALGFRSGAQVEFRPGTLPASGALPPGAQNAILRVAQEALANVARHARATHVAVTLGRTADHVELCVDDDGRGFDLNQEPRGLGLANMRDRAAQFGGRFHIETRPDGGTSLRFSIPFGTRDLTTRPSGDWYPVLSLTPVLIFLLIVAVLHPWVIPAALVVAALLVREVVRYRRWRNRGTPADDADLDRAR